MARLVDRPIADEQNFGVGGDAHAAAQLLLAQRGAGDDLQGVRADHHVGHVERDLGPAGDVGASLVD